MTLSNAEEVQRASKGGKQREYLEKEAKRKRDSYVPSSYLSKEALNNRREELRQKSKRFYWRHKQQAE